MPRGELSSGRHAMRHPLDWYVEEQWVTEQLIRALGGFQWERSIGLAIWDPCCGLGNIPACFHDHEIPTMLSDVVDNVAWNQFGGAARAQFLAADFLELDRAPELCGPVGSIVCNPPYSYRKVAWPGAGRILISEAFARHALRLATRRVCLLVPNKWLASQARFRLFTEHPPAAVLHLTQRPSMPPGDMIAAMGRKAFNGGMIDYCWIVWDVRRPTAPGATRTVWLPPMQVAVAPVEGLA